jgi:hypothetical protein
MALLKAKAGDFVRRSRFAESSDREHLKQIQETNSKGKNHVSHVKRSSSRALVVWHCPFWRRSREITLLLVIPDVRDIRAVCTGADSGH